MLKINNHKTIMFLLVVAVTFLLSSVVECRVGEPASIVTTRNLLDRCHPEDADCSTDIDCCTGLRCHMEKGNPGICQPRSFLGLEGTNRRVQEIRASRHGKCRLEDDDCSIDDDCCGTGLRCRMEKGNPGTCMPFYRRLEGANCTPNFSSGCSSDSDCCCGYCDPNAFHGDGECLVSPGC